MLDTTTTGFASHNGKTQAEKKATWLYERACEQSWLRKVWSTLRGHNNKLLNLTTLQATERLQDYRYVGLQTVPISQIQGSCNQGRLHDFDAKFRPLKRHNQTRWLQVAIARQLGTKLPPVELVQVGNVYFVKDGHHRISVARASGQEEIEAEVTVIQAPRIPQAPPAERAPVSGPAYRDPH